MIIVFTGRKRSGKTAAAQHLQSRYGFKVISFSHPMKAMLSELGVAKQNLFGTEEQKNAPLDILCGKSARWALQTLGTEWGRECISKDLWVRWSLAGVDTSKDWVVDDCRFDNEAHALRGVGGTIVEIAVDTATPADSHASEAGLSVTPDHVIINPMDETFFDMIDHLVKGD